MSLLGGLEKLLGREVQGVKNAYHGLNPFDKQGFAPPTRPIKQVPLYYPANAGGNSSPFPTGITRPPLQGSGTFLNNNSPLRVDYGPPAMGQLTPTTLRAFNGPGGVTFRAAQPYIDPYRGHEDYNVVPLSTGYYRDRFPLQPKLPYLGGQ